MYVETLDMELQKLCIPRGGSEQFLPYMGVTIPGKSGVSSGVDIAMLACHGVDPGRKHWIQLI